MKEGIYGNRGKIKENEKKKRKTSVGQQGMGTIFTGQEEIK